MVTLSGTKSQPSQSDQQPAKPAAHTMKPTPQQLELVSAMADGRLSDAEVALTLEACRQDPALVRSWNTYHLIGDVMRSPVAMHAADEAFLARLQGRLAAEPAPLAVTPLVVRASYEHEAANDGAFRWKMVAGFASLAAVVAIGWSSVGLLTPAAQPQLAQAEPGQILVESPQGTMLRDARLEEMLAAHKQAGGTSALQVPSGFLRNATFETPQGAGR
jgi:sigma-E factor negative regulatory protein RseA